MQLWIVLSLLLSVVAGLLACLILVFGKRKASTSPETDQAAHCEAIQQTLSTATRTMEMHSGELSRFEKLLGSHTEDPAPEVQVENAFHDLRRANQIVDETIDSALVSFLGAFSDMLKEETTQLVHYRSQTQQFDGELEKIDRHSLFASITVKLIEKVQELRRENLTLRNGLEKAISKSKEWRDRAQTAESLARTDSLTKLPNRRFFDEYHFDQHDSFENGGSAYCIILMDIDRFKNLNDRHGHQTGDAILGMVGRIISELHRSSSYPSRIGGEEFAHLLPRCNLATAKLLAERYRQKIEGATLHFAGKQFQVTISCGVAEVQRGETKTDVLRRADLALYQAKQRGRNRVHCDESDSIQSEMLVSVHSGEESLA